MKYAFWTVLITNILLCLFLKPAYAEGEFQADYEVEYAVKPTGVTTVTQRITLTNRLSNIYPKQYSITFDSEKITNVIASDRDGMITPHVTQADKKTTILVTFNDQVVGVGKQLPFTIRFDNHEIAQKNGSIWEITIPGIVETKDLGTYTVSLDVPQSFGPNAYMVPAPLSDRKWTKEQMVKGGVSAAYGQEQFFTIDIAYFLENTQSTKRLTEIALPPDTAFQKVSIRKISPEPLEVVRDEDGNWLARYEVAPKQTKKIDALVTVSITLKPRDDFGTETIDTHLYTASTQYWATNDPIVTDIASTRTTARAIYEYVTKTLVYDYDRVSANPVRKGAVDALRSPKNSVCMEFTDAFIAIARAAGIPARQAVGYAYTTNAKLRPLSVGTDILHAWPEYYDAERSIWIPVDPTWASTTGGVNYFDKLDFNHIVFAINGVRDDYPYPAGSYRGSQTSGKILDVRFADGGVDEHIQGKAEASIVFPKQLISGMPATGFVAVRNVTGVALNDVNVYVSSNPTDVRIENTIPHLAPFTTISIPVKFSTHSIFSSGKGIITATVNGEITTHAFVLRPLYIVLILITGIFIVVAVIVWGIFKRKHIHLPKSH